MWQTACEWVKPPTLAFITPCAAPRLAVAGVRGHGDQPRGWLPKSAYQAADGAEQGEKLGKKIILVLLDYDFPVSRLRVISVFFFC